VDEWNGVEYKTPIQAREAALGQATEWNVQGAQLSVQLKMGGSTLVSGPVSVLPCQATCGWPVCLYVFSLQ